LSRVQTPRPGNLRKMSGVTTPSPDKAKRSKAAGSASKPVTTQVRRDSSLCSRALADTLLSSILVFVGLFRDDGGFDPTGVDPRGHYDRLGFLSRDAEFAEIADELLFLVPALDAFRPTR